ncbi:hypothetical protein BDU57DRAFT_537869 [Ampelomyces quisqualis]|uniref:RBR-type E3 ubiquitin transferase n=1 Tax=Ampelomyces quisqualis TaxID=50730 RepID=A0A6A5QWS5_AMPQU|nr:hypothetical protein BDU57DRAFT_537869 [Ampelomyces quisqualis]
MVSKREVDALGIEPPQAGSSRQTRRHRRALKNEQREKHIAEDAGVMQSTEQASGPPTHLSAASNPNASTALPPSIPSGPRTRRAAREEELRQQAAASDTVVHGSDTPAQAQPSDASSQDAHTTVTTSARPGPLTRRAAREEQQHEEAAAGRAVVHGSDTLAQSTTPAPNASANLLSNRQADNVDSAPKSVESARSKRHTARQKRMAEASARLEGEEATVTQDNVMAASDAQHASEPQQDASQESRNSASEPIFTAANIRSPYSRECCGCGDVFEYVLVRKFDKCTGDTVTCRACFAQWLSSNIDVAARVPKVKCPCSDSDCEADLTWDIARQYAAPETFAIYDHLVTQESLRRDPNFRECLSASCKYGHIQEEHDGNIFKCGACGARHCIRHEVPFHYGESCDEYDVRKRWESIPMTEEDKACKAFVEATSMVCPGCKARVHKSSGCNHMTCKCGHQFCYLCGAPYRGRTGILAVGNAVHRPDCPTHTRNLNTPRAPTQQAVPTNQLVGITHVPSVGGARAPAARPHQPPAQEIQNSSKRKQDSTEENNQPVNRASNDTMPPVPKRRLE